MKLQEASVLFQLFFFRLTLAHSNWRESSSTDTCVSVDLVTSSEANGLLFLTPGLRADARNLYASELNMRNLDYPDSIDLPNKVYRM
jgi:hypothetical protein